MNKTYNISVDCINCANTMEDIANNTPGVIDAAVRRWKLSLRMDRMIKR